MAVGVADRAPLTVAGGALIVWRIEMSRLAALGRLRLVAALCVAGPFAVAATLGIQSGVPEDTLFGRWVHASGFALPLVILSFAGQWVIPVLTAVVAGDIFSSEDHHGTWKTILTRSRSRSEVFGGKLLAALSWSAAAVIVLAVASLAAGLTHGTQPLVDLSGQLQPAGHSLVLVLVSWATVLPPTLGFTAVALLLSVVTRSSVAGVGGPLVLSLVMQLASLVNGANVVRVALLATPFTTWHGLWVDPRFTGPLVQGFVVSAVWFLVAAVVASMVFARRDVSTA